jgi:apolipoprotein N-acyltransferase
VTPESDKLATEDGEEKAAAGSADESPSVDASDEGEADDRKPSESTVEETPAAKKKLPPPESTAEETPAAKKKAAKQAPAESAAKETPAARKADDPTAEETPAAKKKGGKKPPADKPPPEGPPDKGLAIWNPRPIVSNRVAWALVAASIVLCPVAFVGIDIWPLAFVSWIPLIIALRGQTPKRAAFLGWIAGAGMTMIGFRWLVSMLETFSGFPLPLCILFAAIVCLQKGGRIALLGWLYARATHRGWHHGLSFLAAFAVSELVYPVLFPWYFGAAMHKVPIMMQTADLGGPILVSIVVLAVNVALAELADKPLFSLKPDKRTMIAGAALLVSSLGYGAYRIGAVETAMGQAEAIKVGMVQGNSPLHGRTKALPIHVARTAELRKQDVGLVVWSEAAVARGFDSTKYAEHVKEQVTRQLKVPTIVGVVIVERLEQTAAKGRKARFFNSALMADEKGTITGRYDKQFLLMFGEYLPLGDTFPVLYEWSPNSGAFSPGTSFEPLKLGEHRIATMICYEDIIPSFVNKLVDVGDPDLFVNMTNDAWFGDTAEPWQHLALAQFRSVEHRKYMVRVTNSGVTALIDPVGRIVIHGGTFKEEALVGEARFMRMFSLYSKIGNYPWWAVALLLAIAAFVERPGRKLMQQV